MSTWLFLYEFVIYTIIRALSERNIDYRMEEIIIKEIDRKLKEKELLLSKIDFFMNNVTEGGLK